MLATAAECASIRFVVDNPESGALACVKLIGPPDHNQPARALALWFALAELWRRPCQVVWS